MDAWATAVTLLEEREKHGAEARVTGETVKSQPTEHLALRRRLQDTLGKLEAEGSPGTFVRGHEA